MALTVGSFDGVHLGHVDVIRHVVAAAEESKSQPALITFEPHPRCVLDPGNCPQSITSLQEKLALIEAAGVEHTIGSRAQGHLHALDASLSAHLSEDAVRAFVTGRALPPEGPGPRPGRHRPSPRYAR